MGKGRDKRHKQARAGTRTRIEELEAELSALCDLVEPLKAENERQRAEIRRLLAAPRQHIGRNDAMREQQCDAETQRLQAEIQRLRARTAWLERQVEDTKRAVDVQNTARAAAELRAERAEQALWRERAANLRSQPAGSAAMTRAQWQNLVSLVHPDLHPAAAERANEALKWVIAQKPPA